MPRKAKRRRRGRIEPNWVDEVFNIPDDEWEHFKEYRHSQSLLLIDTTEEEARDYLVNVAMTHKDSN